MASATPWSLSCICLPVTAPTISSERSLLLCHCCALTAKDNMGTNRYGRVPKTLRTLKLQFHVSQNILFFFLVCMNHSSLISDVIDPLKKNASYVGLHLLAALEFTALPFLPVLLCPPLSNPSTPSAGAEHHDRPTSAIQAAYIHHLLYHPHTLLK
jgi:hypothetical protein